MKIKASDTVPCPQNAPAELIGPWRWVAATDERDGIVTVNPVGGWVYCPGVKVPCLTVAVADLLSN